MRKMALLIMKLQQNYIENGIKAFEINKLK